MKKKILYIIESLSGGGAEKVLVTTLNHLDKEQFDITLFCIVNTGKFLTELPPHIHYKYFIDLPGNSVISKFIYKIKYCLIYKYLPLSFVSSCLHPSRYDIVISFVEGFSTKLVSHISNKHLRKIAWIHIDLNKYHWTNKVYSNIEEESLCYNRFDEIVTVSDTVLQAFKKEFPNCQCPIRTLYNPIDSDLIQKLSTEPIEIEENSCLRIVSVGRFVEQKSFERLLHIINRLLHSNYSVNLWLIGDGPKRKEFEHYINEHGLASCVRLLGFQSNPYKYMRKCDLFVCSSISEGYSTAVTEALILGLPVVTTSCSGMDELLQYGKYGIITNNSEEALFYGIKSLLDDRQLYESYLHKARIRSKDFSLKELISQVEQFLIGTTKH